MLKTHAIILALILQCSVLYAQEQRHGKKHISDSLYIEQVESTSPDKILHAEPLYIDLIRDLGARKGEKEWNIGAGITDNLKYDTYQTLVEYEFAPVNRLGLEIEVPITFYAPLNGTEKEEVPSHRVESVKAAVQWTFLVSPAANLSAAAGYINELELEDISIISTRKAVRANIYNPFLVVAKRWGNNFHTLIYAGPQFEQPLYGGKTESTYAWNTNIHYMISGTRNFVGMEINKEWHKHDFDMVIRPQLRVGIADNLMIGIVGGIPAKRENQRFSTFARLIWEPGSKHH